MISNPTPRYYRIYRLLKQAIKNLEYGFDGVLPSEHALAKKYDVSRLTIRRSLDLLQQEGLIKKHQGVGTFVSLTQAQTSPLKADINALMSSLTEMGSLTQLKLIHFSYEAPIPWLKSLLELEDDEQVQKSIRVRSYQEQPFSHLTTYVPEAIGRLYSREDLANHPLHELFKKNGIQVHSADQSLTAALADPERAAALNVEPGSALLFLRRLVKDSSGRPIEYLEAAYQPDRYEYKMKLRMLSDDKGGGWEIQNHSN